MEALAGLGALGTVIVAFIGFVLLVLMPFFIYGTNSRTKQTALALKDTNKLLKEIRDELKSGALRPAPQSQHWSDPKD